MRRRVAPAVVAGMIALSGLGVACDREDVRDVEEGVNDVRRGAEEVGEEVEQEIDEADTDGKDN